jgi:hypothetical protein
MTERSKRLLIHQAEAAARWRREQAEAETERADSHLASASALEHLAEHMWSLDADDPRFGDIGMAFLMEEAEMLRYAEGERFPPLHEYGLPPGGTGLSPDRYLTLQARACAHRRADFAGED